MKWERKEHGEQHLVIGDLLLIYFPGNQDAVPEWGAYRLDKKGKKKNEGRPIAGGIALDGARDGKKQALEYAKSVGATEGY